MRTAAFLGLLAFAACYPDHGGADPNTSEFNFPTGVAASLSKHYLFVLNSDFDLRYNSGAVLAMDWDASSDPAKSIASKALACKKLITQDYAADCNPSASTYDEKKCRAELYGAPNHCIQPGFASATTPFDKTLDAPNYVRASVRIGAFGGGLQVVERREKDSGKIIPDSGRILVPVRGDATMTVIDFDEDSSNGIRLICNTNAGWQQKDQVCDDRWKFGDNSDENTRKIKLEGYPISLATPSYAPPTKPCSSTTSASDAGTSDANGTDATSTADECWDTTSEPALSGGIAAIVHQVSGNVSVFQGTLQSDKKQESPPFSPPPNIRLVHTAAGMIAKATSIRTLDIPPAPNSKFVPRFISTNSISDYMSVAQYNSDGYASILAGDAVTNSETGCSSCDRSYMSLAANLPIAAESLGATSVNSDVAIVPPPSGSSSTIYGMYVIARAPASLVVGQFDSSTFTTSFSSILPLPVGPSRIVVGEVDGETRLLITSFDGRFVAVYNPKKNAIENFIPTQKGPYSITFSSITDPATSKSFPVAVVANFTDSTVQVIDLDSSSSTFESVLLTIGVPNAPAQ